MEDNIYSNKGGIKREQAAKLGDKGAIMRNLRWKPDALVGQQTQKRIFYPYLPIKYVKERLVEVCGIGNVQFNYEKENDGYGIGRIGIFIEGEWAWNSALGTERGSNLSDATKKAKVQLKSGHSDAYKSAAELFGLIVPKEIKQVMLVEKAKYIYSKTGVKIGHISWNIEEIITYINNVSRGLPLLTQLWNLYPELHADDGAKALFTEIGGLIKIADKK